MLRLREIRERKGVSLRALKQASGVAVSSLARFEAGQGDPQLSTLRKLAKVFSVTVAELIGEEVVLEQGNLKLGRRGMKPMKKEVRADLRKLKDASRSAKKALEQWRKKYIIGAMSPHMYAFDLEEVEGMIKGLQLKLRNQQRADV